MTRSPEWYAEQSRIAQRKYQHIYWRVPIPRELSRQSPAQTVYPNLRTDAEWKAGTATRREPHAPNVTVAQHLWPRLPKERP